MQVFLRVFGLCNIRREEIPSDCLNGELFFCVITGDVFHSLIAKAVFSPLEFFPYLFFKYLNDSFCSLVSDGRLYLNRWNDGVFLPHQIFISSMPFPQVILLDTYLHMANKPV